jgi:hypothetical protein
VWDVFSASDLASEDTRDKWEVVGEIGELLRGLRNQADYDDDMPNLDRRAPEAVIRAERILVLLPELDLADRRVRARKSDDSATGSDRRS